MRTEPHGSAWPSRRAWWILFAAWWTGFGLLYGSRNRLTSVMRDTPMAWDDALQLGFLDSYLTGAMALVAIVAARRLPMDRSQWRRSLPLHALLLPVVVAGVVLMSHALVPWITELPRMPLHVRALGYLPGNSLIYLLMLGVGYGIEFFRRSQERELRASQLEGQLARARLQMLKMQLHPHFLFNALNSISALMHRDMDAADRMLGRLDDLLRRTLEQAGTQEVMLRDELNLLEPYLEIEQTRFGDRLSVQWDVEPAAMDALVPHLLLQPLVENSIRHGIAPRAQPGRVEISAHRADGMLRLEVRDNGRGLTPGGGTAGAGVGLANTRARLTQLYDGEHRFDFRERPDGGVAVTLSIPYRRAAAPDLMLEKGAAA